MLGHLEREIMEIVWSKENIDARAIHEKLNQKRKLAYTTVNTVLTRLVEKGLLKRERIGTEKKFKYVYTPKKSKVKYEKDFVKNTFESLLKNFGKSTILYFSEDLELGEDEIETLRKRMEELVDE